MKTVKFKDLPEKVQEFCKRLGYAWFGNIVDTEWLHTKADWSKATPSELVSYAKWKFTKGVSYKPIRGGVQCVVSEGEVLLISLVKGYCIHESKKGESVTNEAGYYNLIYDYGWASIISEPEKEKISMEEYEEQLVNKFMKEEQPTFKAGDEVEYCFDAPNGWANGIYIGVHDDVFVVWTGLKYVSTIAIRKPNPDKHLREIAKDIMKTDRLPNNGTHTLYEKNEVESMLIEMGKRVESINKEK